LTAPLDHRAPDPRRIDVYAREYVADGGADRPALLFLQGGPGCPSPRPTAPTGTPGGWLGEALRHWRVILLDQRGTGRSTPVDAADPTSLGATPAEQAEYLTHLRADDIVRDAELLRHALIADGHLPDAPWALLGQSFGGFCITTYLSVAPQGVAEAYLTGGLPGFADDPHTRVDDVYRATYARTAVRNRRFHRRVPWAAGRVREVCAHLDDHDERLPSGERLSSRRFRTVGMSLGRTGGVDTLAYLLEDPFRTVRGERRLGTPFLARTAAMLDLRETPLYAVLHESIYGQDTATAWSADRLRATAGDDDGIAAGFAEDLAGTGDDPVFLTGEHFFPWHLEEDPALRPWRDVAEILARKDDWTPLYDAAALRAVDVPTAAAVYLDDMFVPHDLSTATAELIGADGTPLRPFVTNLWEHNGIGVDGAGILRRLRQLAHDH
ncbi:alpha/beta hydrolase, partial [Corynebacterium bovis]